MITLNLKCCIFPYKNAGAFDGFGCDEVIKWARANTKTPGALTHKPTTPVWLQVKQAVHSQCSVSLGCSLKSLSWWKIPGRGQKSCEARPKSEGTEEERQKAERFPPAFRICTQVLEDSFYCIKRYLQVTHFWTPCSYHHIQDKITQEKASLTFFEFLCN